MLAWMVGLMSVIVAGLIVIWLVSPTLRRRMEMPKHRMLEREQLFRDQRDADTGAAEKPKN